MRALLAGALWIVAASGCSADVERRVARVGSPAPAYEATTIDNQPASLAALRGQVVLLNVWATWCHPCREEIPELERLWTAHEEEGLVVVGVSVDAVGDDSAIRAFAREFEMTYPIWRDPDERIQSLYMALGVPASYLIDRRGVLQWRHLGTVKPTDSSFTNALERALASGG